MEKPEDKRRNPRIEAVVPTKIKKINSDIYKKGKTRDISLSGICLQTDMELEKGDVVEFIVDDDAYGEHYIATGVVTWAKRTVYYWHPHVSGGIFRYGLEIKSKHPL